MLRRENVQVLVLQLSFREVMVLVPMTVQTALLPTATDGVRATRVLVFQAVAPL